MPHVHVDVREQGINENYYFPPAAEPYHEIITDWQREFQEYIGENHNIIEANSDGVRTSTLDSYLNGYANRIIAFRPNLKDSEIRIALKNLYSFLGHDYDFDFDLTSGEKQACSEIVYRSYNGIGNIKLELEVVLIV